MASNMARVRPPTRKTARRGAAGGAEIREKTRWRGAVTEIWPLRRWPSLAGQKPLNDALEHVGRNISFDSLAVEHESRRAAQPERPRRFQILLDLHLGLTADQTALERRHV